MHKSDVIDDAGQLEAFDRSGYVDPDKIDRNQMVVLYGRGPEGKSCKDCRWYGWSYIRNRDVCVEKDGLHPKLSSIHRGGWKSCKRFDETRTLLDR